MQAVRRQVTLAQQHGLFRAATASKVICHLLQANCSDKDKVHSTFESLPKVDDVEFFVSHSWSCASWMKALILSHFLNFDMALTSSFFACLLAVLCLWLRAGSLTGIAEQPPWLLNGSIWAWPLLVFLAVYFLGHLWDSRCFWFDRICVDQQSADLKLQTIQAIPGFVSQSKKMLVLWDNTYFERLWCNYELAIHVKTAASLRATKIVPLWMPLWTLFWICADTMVALLSASEDAALWLYVLFGFLYAAFCFHKLHGHKHMLDQMSTFDLRNAKCAFEDDRAVIEDTVLNLFDEALEPPIRVAFEAPDASDAIADEESQEPLISVETLRAIRHVTSYPSPDAIIDQFNDYVRGPLRQNLVTFLGTEEYIPPQMCVVATLPIWLQSVMSVLSCDGATCEKSAADGGYTSVYQYMITNAVLQLLLLPFGLLILYPMLLRANKFVADAFQWTSCDYELWWLVRVVLGTCLSALVMWCNDHLQLALRGMLFFSTPSSAFLAFAAYAFQCFFMWFLFRRKEP